MNWGISLDAQLERLIEALFVRRTPKIPIMLPRFASTALPDAAAYVGCLIYCPDTAEVRKSDGTLWSAL